MAPPTDLIPGAIAAAVTFDRSGRQLTAYLSGELDSASAPIVSAAIGRHLRADDERLELDLSALTFCDSSGLALLFRLRRQTEQTRTHFALYEPTPPVRRILAICDASGVLPIRS